MALDSVHQYLFLVSTNGTLVRISRASSQSSGTIGTSDIISCNIDDTATDSDTSGGVFGQASADPQGQCLYITEVKDSKSQIWAIPYASISANAKITGTITASTSASSDAGCTGVAVGNSRYVYAYFNTGKSFSTQSDTSITYSGSRLRKGSSATFDPATNVIIDKDQEGVTLLKSDGCLAYDTSNDLLYVGRGQSTMPVLVFQSGTFNTGYPVNQAPDSTLEGPSNADLRILAHAGQKDWLAGAEKSSSDNTLGTNALWIWKAPSVGDTHKQITLGSTVQIKALALDGSN